MRSLISYLLVVFTTFIFFTIIIICGIGIVSFALWEMPSFETVEIALILRIMFIGCSLIGALELFRDEKMIDIFKEYKESNA